MRKNLWKRVSAAAIGLVLAGTLLAGCGGGFHAHGDDARAHSDYIRERDDAHDHDDHDVRYDCYDCVLVNVTYFPIFVAKIV